MLVVSATIVANNQYSRLLKLKSHQGKHSIKLVPNTAAEQTKREIDL